MSVAHKPEATRYLLPPEAYFDSAWHRREVEAIFNRSWLCAGLTADAPAAGDYWTIQAGDHPLVVVRGSDGELRAFHNICRHRGARLVEGKGSAPRGLSCFYHHWHYNLDGALRGVPQAERFCDLDKSRLGLKKAALGEWRGLVFVHPEEFPEVSLADWIAPLETEFGPWRPDRLFETRSVQHEIKANWKLFVENHIDGYHLAHLHGVSIKGLDHSQQRWTPAGQHWAFYEPELRDADGERVDAITALLPQIEGIGPERLGSSVYLMFPSLGMAGGESFFALLMIEPLSSERTRVTVRTFVSPSLREDKETSSFLTPRTLNASPKNENGDFIGEDVYAAEALQVALRSPAFEIGPLADGLEDSIPFFQRSILNALGRAP